MTATDGTRIDEKYTILAPLGSGGVGEVYRAHHEALGREVAIKLLKGIDGADQDTLARFRREAKLLGALKHRNLLSCYEFGEWDGVPFMVMELVNGHTLQAELARNVGLDAKRALNLAKQIGEALECAHKYGIVHRDLKPQNILLCEDDLVKVIDFGFARTVHAGQPAGTQLTLTGMVLGTPAYMAPEQIRGQTVDGRCDIYSFGVVMHHVLAGVAPFQADNPVAMMHLHLTELPPEITRDDLPPGFAMILARCMAKDPADRYQTASDLLRALDMVAHNKGRDLTIYIPADAIPYSVGNEKQTDEDSSDSERTSPLLSRVLVGILAICTIAMYVYLSQLVGTPNLTPPIHQSSYPVTPDSHQKAVRNKEVPMKAAFKRAAIWVKEKEPEKAIEEYTLCAELAGNTSPNYYHTSIAEKSGLEHHLYILGQSKNPPDPSGLENACDYIRLAKSRETGEGYPQSNLRWNIFLAEVYADHKRFAEADKVVNKLLRNMTEVSEMKPDVLLAAAQVRIREGRVRESARFAKAAILAGADWQGSQAIEMNYIGNKPARDDYYSKELASARKSPTRPRNYLIILANALRQNKPNDLDVYIK